MRAGPRPVHILLAEDDEDDRLATRAALLKNRLRNSFATVSDGEELMAYLRREGPYRSAPRPGLILLDLNMPKKDGREALREIKADEKLRSIPVIVLTTSADEEEVVRSYDLGANSYITKPVSFDGLVHALGTLGQYWLQLVELPT